MKTFTHDFDDNTPDSLEYHLDDSERLRVEIQNGVATVFANKAGLLALAKILIQLGGGRHMDGFHVHLREDFTEDADRADALTIVVDNEMDR